MNGHTVLIMMTFQVLVFVSDTSAQTTGLPDKPAKDLYFCDDTVLSCEYGYTPQILEYRRGVADSCPTTDADPRVCQSRLLPAVLYSYNLTKESVVLYSPTGYGMFGCGSTVVLTTYGVVRYVCKFSGFYPTTTTISPPTTTTITTTATTTKEGPTTSTKHTSATKYMTSATASGVTTTKTNGSTAKTNGFTTEADGSTAKTDGSTQVTPRLPNEGGVAEPQSMTYKTKLIIGLSVAGVLVILLIIIIAETRRRRTQREHGGILKQGHISHHMDTGLATKKEDMVENPESQVVIVNETPNNGVRERRFKKKGEDNKSFSEEAKSDKNFPESDSELTVDDGKFSSRDSGVGDATYTDADISQEFPDPDDVRNVSQEFSDPDDGPIDKSSEKGETPGTPQQSNAPVERRHVSFADSSVSTEIVVETRHTHDMERSQRRSGNEAGISGPESEDEVLY